MGFGVAVRAEGTTVDGKPCGLKTGGVESWVKAKVWSNDVEMSSDWPCI